jgi:hypothetical protein
LRLAKTIEQQKEQRDANARFLKKGRDGFYA